MHSDISAKLGLIMERYCDISAMEYDANVFASPLNLHPRDMAAVFLDIERTFSVSIADIVAQLPDFTFGNLVRALENLAA